MKKIFVLFVVIMVVILIVMVVEIMNMYDQVNNVQVFVYQMQLIVEKSVIQGDSMMMMDMSGYDQVVMFYDMM